MVKARSSPDGVDEGGDPAPSGSLMSRIASGEIPWQEVENLDAVMRDTAKLLEKLRTRLEKTSNRATSTEVRQYWAILQSMRKIAAEERATHRHGVERLGDQDWINTQDEDIRDAERSLDLVDALDDAKKKRIRGMLERVLRCHERARADHLHYWAFVGRDQEKNQRLRMAPLHKMFMDSLCSKKRGVLLEAHPETSKTMTVIGWATFELANNPRLRVAYISNQEDRAKRAVGQMRRVFRSPQFKVLYPRIRIMASTTGFENNASRFAIHTGDTTSREYSVQGMPWSANIQGDRFDILIPDDINPEDVKFIPTLRDRINYKFFNVIERRASQRGRRIRFPCTPWHEQDTSGLIEKMHREGRLPDWEIVKVAINDDENGVAIPIWPEVYDAEFYEALKRNPSVDYDRLYRLNPAPKGERVVRSVRYYPASRNDPSAYRIAPATWNKFLERLETIRLAEHWLCFDLASTAATHSSRTWATDIALTAEGLAYVVRAWDMPGDALAARRFALRTIAGEGLFETRYVWTDADREDGEDVKMQKRLLSRDKVEAQGGISVLLYEETGGQKLGTIQFADYIREKLVEMGIVWRGRYYPFRAQAKGGRGILMGKIARLEATAAHFGEGSLRFPGVIRLEEYKNKFAFDADPANEVITRLVGQVMNPAGTLDGLDCLTSFLMANSGKLRRELPTPNVLNPQRRNIQTMSGRISDQIERMWERPDDKTVMQEEDEWLSLSA